MIMESLIESGDDVALRDPEDSKIEPFSHLPTTTNRLGDWDLESFLES